MGWAVGRNNENRWVGYGVPAICDHPKCATEIDRGLGYICGGDINGGEHGCGRFFCAEHRRLDWRRGSVVELCTRCANRRPPYPAKPDTAEWLRHMLSDPTWAEWRRTCRPEYEAALAALFLGETARTGGSR